MRGHEDGSRFDRVATEYGHYRRAYPPELAECLTHVFGEPQFAVADIGAGTGLSAIALSQAQIPVIAIEPSAKMRAIGLAMCTAYHDKVEWRAGTAANTSLATNSVSGIMIGDAIQWLQLDGDLLSEWRRIAAGSRVPIAVVKTSFWNDPVGAQIHRLLSDHGSVEAKIANSYTAADIAGAIMDGSECDAWQVKYKEQYRWGELHGRILSDSHVRREDQELLYDLMRQIDTIIGWKKGDESVLDLEHTCTVLSGRLKP